MLFGTLWQTLVNPNYSIQRCKCFLNKLKRNKCNYDKTSRKEFRILADHGNNDHWKYEVEYMELLSHWPYWENKSKGDFSVRKLPNEEGGEFVVESLHQTCFFGFYCCKNFN